MNAKQFFDLTAKVRKAQKDYFAARKRRGYNAESTNELKNLLATSKSLENQLDKEIERVMQIEREAMEPRLNFE